MPEQKADQLKAKTQPNWITNAVVSTALLLGNLGNVLPVHAHNPDAGNSKLATDIQEQVETKNNSKLSPELASLKIWLQKNPELALEILISPANSSKEKSRREKPRPEKTPQQIDFENLVSEFYDCAKQMRDRPVNHIYTKESDARLLALAKYVIPSILNRVRTNNPNVVAQVKLISELASQIIAYNRIDQQILDDIAKNRLRDATVNYTRVSSAVSYYLYLVQQGLNRKYKEGTLMYKKEKIQGEMKVTMEAIGIFSKLAE